MPLPIEVFNQKVKNGEKVTVKDIPEGIDEITPELLQNIIAVNVREGNEKALEEFKRGMNEGQRKRLFDGEDGGENQIGKSVIDSGFFTKGYAGMSGGRYDPTIDGKMLGQQLLVSGGPFKSLSNEMNTFAECLKCKFNTTEMARKGIDHKEFNEQLNAQYKALGMSEGVSADGGATVPVEYAATVIEFAVSQSPILSKVWRYPMSSSSLKIPKLTQSPGSYFGGLSLYWADEAATKTSSKPLFSQLTFTAHKLIGLVYLTDELIADSNINIVNYVTGLFTRAFQYETERVIIDGSGSSQPLGIINDPQINIVQRNSEGTINYADICNLEADLDENFTNLDWITRRKTFTTLRNLRDNNNAPIFRDGYHQGLGNSSVPPTMSGYPIHVTRNVPSIGNQGDIVLGDLRYYILANRQDLKIDGPTIYPAFTTDESAIRFVARMDGKPAVSDAFSVLDEMGS